MTRRKALRGYSHNVRYHTRVYHVQTAFVGSDDPQVVSHLFVDGLIVSTTRSACSAGDDNEHVQALMKEQHRQMLRGLRRGDFDERVVLLLGRLKVSDTDPWEAPEPAKPAKPAKPPPPPPPSDDMTPGEARAIRRGRRISRELAPLAGQPPGEIPIPLEHPAFSGIPMIEWEESERSDSLELDLGAIDQLDMDEATTTFVPDTDGPGGELDLDALYDDEDDEALLAAFPPPVPEVDQDPRPPEGREWDPPTPVDRDTRPPLAKLKTDEMPLVAKHKTDEMPLVAKHPSLPLPMMGEQVDEAFFRNTPVDEDLPESEPVLPPEPELSEAEREFSGNKRQLKTLTFPPPFEHMEPDSSDNNED